MASQVSKLRYVDSKLGAPTSGQQTTRIIYNTVLNPANGTVVEFFKSFNGQTLGQSNITQGKLDSSESMVIKTIQIFQYDAEGNPRLVGGQPLLFLVSIIVGNQTVVKDFPLGFQGGASGQPFDRLHDASSYVGLNGTPSVQVPGPYEARLLTDIVIPPQTEFSVRLQCSGSLGTDTPIVCVLAGYGKIFSAGASF